MYNYELKFTSVPPPVYAGFFNQTPFYISLSSTKLELENHQINLFAQNSNSAPYQIPQNKWSHLVPQWKFTDSNGEYIEFVTPYFKASDEQHFVYEASAYYVDNLAGDVTIIATLETSGFWVSSDNPEANIPSYSNSLIADTVEYSVFDVAADHMEITQDGKNPIDWTKWTDTKIPFLVTFHPDSSSTLINTNTQGLTNVNPIVYRMPINPDGSYLTLYVSGLLPSSSIMWDQASSVSLSAFDAYGFTMGGFYKGWFESPIAISATKLYATYDEKVYESDFAVEGVSNWDSCEAPISVSEGILRFQDSNTSCGKMFRLSKFKNLEPNLVVDVTLRRSDYYFAEGSNARLRVFDDNFQVIQTFPKIGPPPWYIPSTDFTNYVFTLTGVSAGYIGFSWDSFSSANRRLEISSLNIYGQTLSGISNEFQIKSFERPYDIRRFNESWNAGDVIHSYALAEHTYSNPVFFDNFMEVSVGGEDTSYQSLGRTMYERIANFVKNHADIDVCNLNQIYSLHEAIDCPIDDYRMGYPSEIRRLVDILSVKKNRLLPGTCKCCRNFVNSTDECIYCGHIHPLNRERLSYTSTNYTITANMPFVVENIYSMFDETRYDVIFPTVCDLGGNQEALMSSLPFVAWLSASDYPKYSIYNYVSGYCNTQVEGLINWSDTYTTLASTVSSLDAWYGHNGLVEEMLNYEIHRGLYNG